MKSAAPQVGVLGRVVRLAAAALIVVSLLLTVPAEIARPDGLFWALVVIGFVSLHEPAALVLGASGARRSRSLALGAAAAVGLLNRAAFGSWWMPMLGWYCYAIAVGVNAAWSISFGLAGVLGTPGCEWGALRHLVALARGREFSSKECSLGLGRLDAWESRRKSG